MTKVVFETATIADSLRKAERVAPSKGQAFDKAAGIVLEIHPGTDYPVIIRATNLDVYYMEWVDCISAEGPTTVWRVPSKLVAGAVGSLPIGTGKTVTFEEKIESNGVAKHLAITSGRTKAKLNLIDPEYYPVWEPFDPDLLTQVPDLGGKIGLVEWATAKNDFSFFSGVHLDGDQIVATDKHTLARVSLKMGLLDRPVTIPAGVLTTVLKQTGDVGVATSEHQLYIMPDEHTQLRTVIFAGDYPKTTKITRTEWPDTITLRKSELLEIINRAVLFNMSRIPKIRLFIGKEEIAVMMQDADIGMLGDVIEVPGQALHARGELKFNPNNLKKALESAPNEEVTLGYDFEKLGVGAVYVNGGSGYEVWVMPLRDGEGDSPYSR